MVFLLLQSTKELLAHPYHHGNLMTSYCLTKWTKQSQDDLCGEIICDLFEYLFHKTSTVGWWDWLPLLKTTTSGSCWFPDQMWTSLLVCNHQSEKTAALWIISASLKQLWLCFRTPSVGLILENQGDLGSGEQERYSDVHAIDRRERNLSWKPEKHCQEDTGLEAQVKHLLCDETPSAQTAHQVSRTTPHVLQTFSSLRLSSIWRAASMFRPQISIWQHPHTWSPLLRPGASCT